MGVLHTSSYYAKEKIDASFSPRSKIMQNSALSFLESEERKLYQAFGCADFESFKQTIKDLFSDGNVKVIQNFQPAILSEKLSRFAGGRGELYNEKVHFIFDLSKVKDINFKIDEVRNSDFLISSQGDKVTLGFEYNSKNVKTIFRDIYKNRHFIPESADMTAINARLKVLTGDDGILTITTENPSTGVYDEEFVLSPIPNFPWGCTKKIYDEAVKEGREDILKDFQKAGEKIKYFICEELCAEASPELKKAVSWTWRKNFPNVDRDPAFFFQGTSGSNFISAVQGSLGEFQAAVIFTFLEQKMIRKNKYATIVGDKLKHGEQLKTDVSIIENLGLQVKNMNTFENDLGNIQLIRDLETNIHPKKLSAYLDNADGFLDFIANYYFNATYARESESTFNQLIAYLGTYLGELMNFAMGKVADTVSFYFIGGKYLVPASRILKAAQELNLEDSIEITSSYNGLLDLEYELPIHKNKKGGYSPLYTEYWTHTYGDQSSWHPTGKNQNLFGQLINRSISIRTKFNLFSEIEKYAIF